MPAPPSADETALLAAVAADPAAELPRLVLADYFEERADPRGEYIRLECHLSHLAVEHAEWPLVAGRMAELRAEWPEPIDAWADHVGAARMTAALPRLREKLERRRRDDRRLRRHGHDSRRYQIDPPRTEAEVAEFETHCGVRLPGEYRAFVLGFGDGGVEPALRLHRLLVLPNEANLGAAPLWASLVDAGRLGAQLRADPDLRSAPPLSAETFPRLRDAAGALIIVSGVGDREEFVFLVLVGELRGTVWHYTDHFSPPVDCEGYPLHPLGHPLGFLDWYEAWLDSSLATPPRL